MTRPKRTPGCPNCAQLDEDERCAECEAVKGELAYDAFKEKQA